MNNIELLLERVIEALNRIANILAEGILDE